MIKPENIKKHGNAVLFLCVLNVGASAPNPDARNFSRKVSWNFKSFAKIKRCVRCEVFADFQGAFFKKPLEAKFGTQFQHILIKEKRGFLRVFYMYLILGLPPPNPDTRNFSRKVSCESSKASPKIKWCVRWEILLPTFLIRKVGSLAHLSTKERCVYNIFLHKNTSASETYNCNFSFNGKIRIYFRAAKSTFFK